MVAVHQAGAHRPDHWLPPEPEPQLLSDARHRIARGQPADGPNLADLPVGQPLGKQLQETSRSRSVRALNGSEAPSPGPLRTTRDNRRTALPGMRNSPWAAAYLRLGQDGKRTCDERAVPVRQCSPERDIHTPYEQERIDWNVIVTLSLRALVRGPIPARPSSIGAVPQPGAVAALSPAPNRTGSCWQFPSVGTLFLPLSAPCCGHPGTGMSRPKRKVPIRESKLSGAIRSEAPCYGKATNPTPDAYLAGFPVGLW